MFDKNPGPGNQNRPLNSPSAPMAPKANRGGVGRTDSSLFNNSEPVNTLEGKDKIEDIFSETESSASGLANPKPPVFQPKKAPVQEPEKTAGMPPIKDAFGGLEQESQAQRLFIAAAVVIGLLLIGLGGWFVYKKVFTITVPEIVTEDSLINKKQDTQKPQPETPAVKPQPETPAIDSDQDGLTDEEEKKLGTDINLVDSDADGLFDKEEVRVYKTDPLKKDTDGDGHLDGAEVKQGFDPLGPGKLFNREQKPEEDVKIDCPGVCMPLWDKTESGCVYDKCGSGCGADSETSFGTEVDCLRVYNMDTDGDGLLDREEEIYGSDPDNPDTDGDGYSDGEEVVNGYDPNGGEKL